MVETAAAALWGAVAAQVCVTTHYYFLCNVVCLLLMVVETAAAALWGAVAAQVCYTTHYYFLRNVACSW